MSQADDHTGKTASVKKPTKRKTCKKSSETDTSFDRFWSAYPRKVGKKKARQIWVKLNPTEDLQERILAAVETQTQSEQWMKDGGAFIPHPSTWLNGERWSDEVESEQSILDRFTAPASEEKIRELEEAGVFDSE